MRGFSCASVASLILASAASPAWADQGADLRLVGSTVAQPAGKYWRNQNLGLSILDPELVWPRIHAEVSVDTERVEMGAAYTDLGSQELSLRLGLFRLPLGRSNAVGIGDGALASRPLILEEVSLTPIAGAGGLANLKLGGFSLSGGVAHGGNPFFGGGQVGVLRWAWVYDLPGGVSFETGASGATNQVSTLAGADVTLSWHGWEEVGVLLGAEGLGGWGGWLFRRGFGAGGYGLAAVSWRAHELAVRYDLSGVTQYGADRDGLAVAYGLRVGPRSVLRLELGSWTGGTPYVPDVPVDRALVQLVFSLGASGGERASRAGESGKFTVFP